MKYIPGDYVRCLRDVEFTDGSKHVRGEEIEVTENNVDHFNSFPHNYFLIGHVS